MCDKQAQLKHLALKRQLSVPTGFNGIGDYRDGVYECDYVSPYSKPAHNTASQLLIMLQDWISHDVLAGPINQHAITLGRLPHLPTNRNLDRFLTKFFSLDISEVYATNLFPFVKPGHMSSSISFKQLRATARHFGLPQIAILNPTLVVSLGLDCTNALRVEAGHRRFKSISQAIDNPFKINESMIWCQAHPGALGQINRNKTKQGQTDEDWQKMFDWYSTTSK